MLERGNARLKRADRLLGIPLVWLLGRVRRRRPPPATLEGAAVGVLSPAAIGDTILATGLLQDLAGAGASVTLITSHANADIVPLVIPLMGERAAHLEIPTTSPIVAISRLRHTRFDVLIDVTPWSRFTALLAGVAPHAHTIGFRTAHQHRHWPFDALVELRHDIHQSENYSRLSEPLGVTPTHRPRVTLPDVASVHDTAAPFVVFHPWPGGSRKAVKAWPFDRWIALGTLVAEAGYAVVITGGPGDVTDSDALAAALRAVQVHVEVLAGRASLSQTAVALAAARAVVSVDTGVLHLASALHAPTIGLHGPTSSRRWGGVGTRTQSIDAPGGGQMSLGFEDLAGAEHLMRRIDVTQVWALLAPLL